jgi:hypothetical protein
LASSGIVRADKIQVYVFALIYFLLDIKDQLLQGGFSFFGYRKGLGPFYGGFQLGVD